jgi:hypothetical protein
MQLSARCDSLWKDLQEASVKKPFLLLTVLAAAAGSVFAEAPRESQQVTRSDEQDIYGMFLDRWTRGSAQIIQIARIAQSPPAEAMAEFATCLNGQTLAGLTGSELPLQLSETALARRANVRLVDPKEWRPRDPGPAMAIGKPTSKAVSEGFAAGLLTLSRMIFDKEHKVAIFSYSFVCGRLCGSGGAVIFDKTTAGWKQRAVHCGGWVS